MGFVVLYHYPCPDGVFAAYAAHLSFTQRNITDVKYIPLSVFSLPEERLAAIDGLTKDDVAFLCDYSGGTGFLLKLADKVQKVTFLDHHKTALEDVEGYKAQGRDLASMGVDVRLDMERSGAVISLDYFVDECGLTVSSDLRKMFAYIQDADLWTHALPDCKAFSAGLAHKCIEYDPTKNTKLWEELGALHVDDIISTGKEVVAANQQIITTDLNQLFPVSVTVPDETGGQSTSFKFFAVVTEHPELRSEMGNQLAELSGQKGFLEMGAICYRELKATSRHEDEVKVSLRSKGEVDTTVITKHYGGGGHRNASSCFVTTTQLDEWKA